MSHNLNGGIYKITNKSNGRIYVGSTNHFDNRRREHFSLLKRGIHHSPHLQRAYNKKPEDFSFEVYIVCSNHMLLCYEQLCIDFLKPFYNSSKTAGKVEFTSEVREKISRTHKERYKNNPELLIKSRERMLALGDNHWMKDECQRERMRKNNPQHIPEVKEKNIEKLKKWIENNPEKFLQTRKDAGETLKRKNKEDPSRLDNYKKARLTYANSEEGKQEYKKRGNKISLKIKEFAKTEEGKTRFKKGGLKSGKTRKERGSQSGDNHWTRKRGGHSEETKLKLSLARRGKPCVRAKLQEHEVLYIRQSNEKVNDLAERFNVTRQTIRNVKVGKSYGYFSGLNKGE